MCKMELGVSKGPFQEHCQSSIVGHKGGYRDPRDLGGVRRIDGGVDLGDQRLGRMVFVLEKSRRALG